MNASSGAAREFLRNIPKLYGVRALFWMHFHGAVLAPFYTQWGGLSLTEMMLLNSWFMLWSFALEVPTGAVADFLGRRISLALGALTAAIAAVVYASHPSIYLFLAGEVLFAIAYTLQSGADEALAYDSLKAGGQESSAARVFARMESYKLGGIVIAAASGGLIAAHLGLAWPLRLYVIPALLGCGLALTLKDVQAPVAKQAGRSYLALIRDAGRYFAGHALLLRWGAEIALSNALAFGVIWLYQPLLLQLGMPVKHLGWFHAAVCIAQILALSSFSKLERGLKSKRAVLALATTLAASGALAAAFAEQLWLAMLALLFAFGFGLPRMAIFSALTNQMIPSEERATTLSFLSMLRTFAIVVMNPALGALADVKPAYAFFAIGGGLALIGLATQIDERRLHTTPDRLRVPDRLRERRRRTDA